MPLFSAQNEYAGVNAHFQSYCQAENDWESFHGQLIAELAKQIGQTLPAGYVVKPEQGLQIREIDPLRHEERYFVRKSDATIYQIPTYAHETLSVYPHAEATLTLKAITRLEPDDYLRSLNIYDIQAHPRFGQPVVHVEILSATNKRGGSGYEDYRDKRLEILSVGVHLVEIDLLHESISPIHGLPNYRRNEALSSPYYIALSPMQSHLGDVVTYIYQFGVDENFPQIQIPLKNPDFFVLACQLAYDAAYTGVNAFRYVVDYDNLPAHFERYSPDDQAKIRAVMARVQERG